MKSNNKLFVKKDREITAFGILLAVMAVYYGYRMFALTPWYDELYTYYYFISKGPVYAAIHWPLPNNHVGYSVLSGILNYLGNPYIGLRGVSYLCALLNLLLLFRIGRFFFKKGISLAVVLLYLSMNLVNQLAVQGRGYTLGITCYLAAICALLGLIREGKAAKRYFFLYGLALVLGLYTLTSDVYWVLPLCLAGGCYLLLRALLQIKQENLPLKQTEAFGKLLRLILTSLAAALMTVFLYTLIWLAIGSNLLVKEEGGLYYGMSHLSVIISAPLTAVKAGIEYMLSMPYIQGVERAGYLPRLWQWIQSLFRYYYAPFSGVLLCLVGAGLILSLLLLIRGLRRKESEHWFLPLLLLVGLLCIPLFLLIQCALPYYRVFTFGGVLVALLLGVLFQLAAEKRKELCVLFPAGALVAACCLFAFGGYQEQYSTREHELQEALDVAEISSADTLCVTDCNQQYLLKFLYGITCENTQIEGADRVLLDKRMTDPEFDEMIWEFYHYYQTIPWDYLEQEMVPVYVNDSFILYCRKGK